MGAGLDLCLGVPLLRRPYDLAFAAAKQARVVADLLHGTSTARGDRNHRIIAVATLMDSVFVQTAVATNRQKHNLAPFGARRNVIENAWELQTKRFAIRRSL